MNTKERLSASVDADLIRAAEAAVKERRSDSVSAWVNDALRLKAEQDARLNALEGFLLDYESRHGVIEPDEIRRAARRAQQGSLQRVAPRSRASASRTSKRHKVA